MVSHTLVWEARKEGLDYDPVTRYGKEDCLVWYFQDTPILQMYLKWLLILCVFLLQMGT